jgi:integrase
MSKAQALSELAAIVAPINSTRRKPSDQTIFDEFVQQIYLPFYRRKWKRSTAMTNEDRITRYLTSELGPRSLGSFERDELQGLLDARGRKLSFHVVTHLRWDLKQIFDMAVAEGYLRRNPATLLFTPRYARRPTPRIMTVDEVRQLFQILDVRERLIAKLAVLAGMRPGEIFALK